MAVAPLAALSACDPAAALVLLAEGADGVGRMSRDMFVRCVAAMVIVARRGPGEARPSGGSEADTAVLEAVAPFGYQLFDALHAAAQHAAIVGAAEPTLYFTFVAAALLSASTAPDAAAWRQALPFLLHDTGDTGYIDAARLQEYVFAAVVMAALASGLRAQAAADSSLSTRRAALGYHGATSPAGVTLLAPSRRKDALMASMAATTQRGAWVGAGSPATAAPLVPLMTPALAESLVHEARITAGSAIDDVRFGRFDPGRSRTAHKPVLTLLSPPSPPPPRAAASAAAAALASVTGVEDGDGVEGDALPGDAPPAPTWRLSREAYAAWLSRSGSAH